MDSSIKIKQSSTPPVSPPARLVRSRASHLAVSSTMLRGIVRLQNACLRLVGLGEGIATLFTHALDLPDFPDRLLELFHPRQKKKSQHTEATKKKNKT